MNDTEDLTITQLIEESHATAVEKGWWDVPADGGPDDRGFAGELMLMVSELSEALEEYRNGHPVEEIWYGENGKPEGVPVELADVFIRMADSAGQRNIPILRAIREKLAYNKTRSYRHGGKRL